MEATTTDLLAMIGEYEVIVRKLKARVALLEQALAEQATLKTETATANG